MSRTNYKDKDSKSSPNPRSKQRGKSNSRGNKSNSRTKKEWEKEAGVNNPDKYPNTPAYYFTSKELAEQASQLSFQSFLGNINYDAFEAPSVLRVETVMCPNVTERIDDAVNSGVTHSGAVIPETLATKTSTPANYISKGKTGVNFMGLKLYTTLSQFTGRTASYGPQDVTAMILALGSFAEVSEHVRRIFGVALTYSDRNRAMPIGLLQAMISNSLNSTVAVSNFIPSISIYRMRFNVLMTRINQIPLLQNVAFIVKCQEFYQKVWRDDQTNMSQLWFYAPKYAYEIDETGWTGGTVLKAVDITQMDVGTLLTTLESMVNALLESSTLNFIYADILNMSTKLKVPTWQFDYLAEDYRVYPEYNPMANMMLANSTIVGRIDNSTAGYNVYNVGNMRVTNGPHIYSDVNRNEVVYNPIFAANSSSVNGWLNRAVINLPNDNPTVEERIEALRMTSLASGMTLDGAQVGRTTGTNYITGFALPDHYITEVVIGTNWSSTGYTTVNRLTSSAVRYGAVTYEYIINQFDAFPNLWVFNNTGTPKGRQYSFKRLDYFTEVDYTYVNRLLDCMSSGLFDFRIAGSNSD